MRPDHTASGFSGYGLLAIVLAVLAACGLAWSAAHLAHIANAAPPVEGNPFEFLVDTVAGRQSWPSAASWWLAGLAVLVSVPALLVFRAARRWERRAESLESRSSHLEANPSTLRRYVNGERGPGVFSGPGPLVGHVINNGRPSRTAIRIAWEDVAMVVAGPRTGKTVAIAVPAICEAPGTVLATSNKRDLYDTTSALRREAGTVWLFDPQAIIAPEPSCWWNPLRDVTGLREARRLSTILTDASRRSGDRADAFFDPMGRELLALLLLAAAKAGKPMTAVLPWIDLPADRTPVTILRGVDAAATSAMEGMMAQPDKQRGGVYSTARKAVAFLGDPLVREWVEPPGDDRPEFVPSTFARSQSDTVYLLAREGEGSSAPLVTALAAAILLAAEHHAAELPHGRLALPMTAVLDEAANVCRWQDLPDLYSHYGSRGIVLITILQSWAQGAEVWGERGVEKLWGAANVNVYLGGVSDTSFLRRISDLCGQWDAPTLSRTVTSGPGSTSISTRMEPVFPVHVLAALPTGRAVVMLSGTPAVLVATQPWTAGPHADRLRQALADPQLQEVPS